MSAQHWWLIKHRTDVFNPWTLCFLDASEERDYASYHADIHIKYTALGSLAEVLLPFTMAFKVLASCTFTQGDVPFQGVLIGAMVVARGLPFLLWILSSKTPTFHAPVLLISRLNNVFITFNSC